MAELKISASDELHNELKTMIFLAVQDALSERVEREASYASRDYFSKSQAADYLSISQGTLNKYLAEGLQSTKIGGRIFIAKADIKKYLEAHKN